MAISRLFRIIFLLTFVISFVQSYQKPACYWYWWEGVKDLRDLRWDDIDSRNQGDLFNKRNDNNWKKRYYVKYDLMRKEISRNEIIPLKGNPSALDVLLRSGARVPVKWLYDRVPGGVRVDERVDSQIEDWGWLDHSRQEIVLHAIDKWGYDFSVAVDENRFFNSIEEGLMIYNHARHYEYGPGKDSYDLGNGADDPQKNFLFSSLLGSLHYRTSDIRQRVLAKKSLVRYGDLVRLVSRGSFLTLYALDIDKLPQSQKVFASHDDTADEYDKFKKIDNRFASASAGSRNKKEDPSELGWFYVKGRFKEGARWNCKPGDPIKNGDIVRLEHVISKKVLIVDKANAPQNAKLFFGKVFSLGFGRQLDLRYRGSPSIVSVASGFPADIKDPGKAASDEKLVSLGRDAIGSSAADFKIVVKDSGYTGDLAVGQLIHFESVDSPGTYLWSQHAFFEVEEKKNISFGLVSALQVSDVAADLPDNAWFVSALDSMSAEEVARMRIQRISEYSESVEKNLAAMCHAVLQASDKIYFDKVVAPDAPAGDVYPEIKSAQDAKLFFEVFIDFYNSIKSNFWTKSFAEASSTVTKLLEKLRENFATEDDLLKKINDFELSVLSKNPAFKKRSFKDLMIVIDKLFAAGVEKADELKSSIDSVIKSKLLLFEKTGFKSLDDLLAPSGKLVEDKNNSQIGASILLAWVRNNKAQLIATFSYSEQDIAVWLKVLQDAESNIYTDDNPSSGLGSASIKDALDFLEELISKDSLMIQEKKLLVQKFLKIFSTGVDSMLSSEQVDIVNNGLKLLGAKFSLATDSDVGKDFSDLIAKVGDLVVFGLDYLIGQFKSRVIDLQDETSVSQDAGSENENKSAKVTAAIADLKSILQLKAGFDLVKKESLQSFVDELDKALKKTKLLTNYEKSFDGKRFDDAQDKIAVIKLYLQESPTFNDYMFFVKTMTNQVTQAKKVNKQVISLLTSAFDQKIFKSPFLNQISSVSKTQLLLFLDLLNSKSIKITNPALDSEKLSFDAFLKNRFAEIKDNIDKSGNWKTSALTTADSDSKMSFIIFCEAVLRFAEFNPDFDNDTHKFGMISLLKFVKSTFDLIKQRSSEKDLQFERFSKLAKAFIETFNNPIFIKTSSKIIMA